MVSSNIFHNVADIAEMALDVLHNNLKFASRVNRNYDKTYTDAGAKQGDTYNVRVPGFMTYRDGAVAKPSAYNDTYVPITLSQGGCDARFTSAERTLNVDAFKQNVLAPLMAPVFNTIDQRGLNLAYQLSQFAGTPGTLPTNGLAFLKARSLMEKQSALSLDGQLSGMLDGDMQASALQGLSTLFNPSKTISDQYRNGSLGEAYGIDFFSTANAPSQVLGTWGGTPVVGASNGSTTDGGNTMVTAGWTATSTSLNVGDCFTIAGVYAVNPVGKSLTNQLKPFTVTVKTVTDGAGASTITFDPPMILTGPQQNINALPITSAAIYMWAYDSASKLATGAGTVSPTSLVFHKDAFVLGLADLEDTSAMGAKCSRMRDPRTGLNCRVTEWYDGINDAAIIRIDVLYGWNLLRKGFATKVQG